MTVEEAAFQRWTRWIDSIHKDVTDLVIGRHIFWQVQDIIKANQRIQIPSSFYGWVGMAYAAWGPMGVRRQLDMDDRSISLRRLLTEIVSMPQVLSRGRYISIYSAKLAGGAPAPSSQSGGIPKSGAYAIDIAEAEDIASRSFDQYAGQRNEYIPARETKRDLQELLTQTQMIERFATKKVAHLDEKPPTTLPTFDELDACVALLERLVLKYELILTASAPQSLLPTWQYDWKAIFYEPWISRP
jgi:hypothetical protein